LERYHTVGLFQDTLKKLLFVDLLISSRKGKKESKKNKKDKEHQLSQDIWVFEDKKKSSFVGLYWNHDIYVYT